MTIPDKVRICGSVYTVEVEPESPLEQRLSGCVRIADQVITLMEAAPDYMAKVFLHECIHAMMHSMGIHTKDHDEVLIEGLSHQLFMLVQDNPEIFAPMPEDLADGE